MNPFLKRATEQLSDPEAFLGLVSPEPVGVYLQPLAEQDALYDRLIMVQGTPGSGKTTIGRLFTLPVVCALLRHRDAQEHRPTLSVLSGSRVTDGEAPSILGYRLPLEAEYRDLWELPYDVGVRIGLTRALVQARTVLGWLRVLDQSEVNQESLEFQLTEPAGAAAAAIGGATVAGLKKKAQEVERSIYRTATALVAPDLETIDTETLGAYRPFDVITGVRCRWGVGSSVVLKPLVILDDAHVLHPEQFGHFKRWLMQRELSIARWLLTRMDVLTPADALRPSSGDGHLDQPGVTAGRDFLTVQMQAVGVRSESGRTRTKARTDFRRMVKDMGDRYLKTMPVFLRRNRTSLSSLLIEEPVVSSESDQKKVRASVNGFVKRARVPDSVVRELRSLVEDYAESRSVDSALTEQMLLILLNRYAKRRPQRGLFEETTADVNMPQVSSGVEAGARIQLFHRVNRPYYHGVGDLCDASGENVEQFLRLAGSLVEVAELNIIRRRNVISLTPKAQHKLLRERAAQMLRDWQFPMHSEVRNLVDGLAQVCLERSLEPNAPLDAGANALGIPQQEYNLLFDEQPWLARVLQFAVAHNAISLVPNYPQGGNGKEWCLIEVCGPAALVHGLTLKRGGFVEGNLEKLAQIAGEPS